MPSALSCLLPRSLLLEESESAQVVTPQMTTLGIYTECHVITQLLFSGSMNGDIA